MNSQPVFELSHQECRELLYTGVFGRVALHTPIGTRIVPVNYSIVEDAIVWRTAPYSELGTYAAGVEGVFEIDDLDRESHQGWSVIARGTIEVVENPEDIAEIRRVEDPSPWADGLRHLYMRMSTKNLTGRRLGFAPHGSYLDRPVPPTRVAETAGD